MNVNTLLEQLELLGIELWEENGELRFKAPKGTFSEHLRNQVKQNRDALIRYLRNQNIPQHDAEHAYEPFPLTDVQASYLIGRTSAYANGNTGCHGYAEFNVTDSQHFSANEYRAAWRKVINCHGMLKAEISPEGWQKINPSLDIPLRIIEVENSDAFQQAQLNVRAELRAKQYDIDKPPYITIVLISSATAQSLHLSIDLIIADFIGLQTLFTDFAQALLHPNTPLPKPTLDFRDYLAYMRQTAASATGQQAKAQALSYWKTQLATLPPPMSFGRNLAAETNNTTQVPQYRRRVCVLAPEIWNNIQQQARDAGLTPNAIILAVLARVARRYSNQDQSTITATLLDRAPISSDVDRIVGDFTSTLLIALDGGKEDLITRAQKVQENLFSALEHRALSGIEIARLYERETGNKSNHSDVVVTSTIGTGNILPNTPLRNKLAMGLSQTPQVLLDVQLSDHEGGLAIVWDSRDGGYPEPVLDSAFNDFTQTLERLSQQPQLWYEDVLERRPLIAQNLTQPSSVTLLQDWLQFADNHPSAPAVEHGNIHLTHSELLHKAQQYRNQLYAQKLMSGDTVFIQLPHGIEQIAAQIGTLLAGGIFVPVHPEWPQERLNAMRATLNAERPNHQCHTINTTIQVAKSEYLPEKDYAANVSDIAYIIFTSGSTGTPKGVPITHGQVMTTLHAMTKLLSLNHDDRVFALSQPTFDLAIFNVFALLNVGGVIVLPQDKTGINAASWLQDIQEKNVTIWNSVPAQLQLLLDHLTREQSSDRLDTLRAALLSGDWIPVNQPDLLAQFAPQCCFFALGGATEASIWSNYHLASIGKSNDQRSIPYGRPLLGQDMRILNNDLEEAVTGQVGDIVISGGAVSQGYLGASNQPFFTHPDTGLHSFITGDYGRYLDNGEIEFLGRKDAQIKLHGYRIEPGDIETALNSHSDVEDSIVFVDNQQLNAVIKAKPSAAPIAETIIQALIDTHTSFLDNIDKNACLSLFEQINQASLCAMQAIFQEKITPAPAHEALLKRWSRLLAQSDQKFSPQEATLEHAQALLQAARGLSQKIDYGEMQIDYVMQCISQLDKLVRGEVDPISLLFPEGKMDIAHAAYGQNLINNHLNNILKNGIYLYAEAAVQSGKTLRILEIGGGVGATTQAIIPVLEHLKQSTNLHYEYVFSDVSQYFLSSAKATWPQLQCQLFDLNKPFSEQGIKSNYFDIILCANVLHNARHIPTALEEIHTLLTSGGALAAIDACRPNAALMITMEFKEGLEGFTDERAEREEVFFDYSAWQRALARSPFGKTIIIPDDCSSKSAEHNITEAVNGTFHQAVIWAQKNTFSQTLNADALKKQLRQQIPEYMIPATFTILAQFPLTTNGKIDRHRLLTLVRQTRTSTLIPTSLDTTSTVQTALTAEQSSIADIWREVLELDENIPIQPNDDFFAIGGDSLLLARCIGRMRKEIPGGEALAWDDLLRQIVANPTLDHCTSCFFSNSNEDSQNRNNSSPASPLTMILPKAGECHDDDCAIVLVHDGSGGITPYQEVIAAFSKYTERPACFGLSRTPDDQYLTLPAEELFEHLAERYVTAIEKAGYKKVYLFGYCMGGLIAAAMAARMLESGIDVANLSIISAYRIPFIVQDNLMLDYAFARLLGEDPILMGLDFDEKSLGALMTIARQRYNEHIPEGTLVKLASEFPDIAVALTKVPSNTDERLDKLVRSSKTLLLNKDDLHALREIYIASMQAVAAFEHPGYFGDITFLRQRGDIHFLPQLKEDMTLFWQDYCLGELNILDIEGNHFTCLVGENAEHVAAELAKSWQ